MEERTSDEDSKEVNSVSTADVILESKYSDMTTQIKFIGLEKQLWPRMNNNSRKLRSAKRMRTFWRHVRYVSKCVVSSIILKDSDNRPYLPLTIGDKLYFGLLDSGANKSVVGGKLADVIGDYSSFTKYHGTVRTADGQTQRIIGIADVEFTYQDRLCKFEFLVIPSIKQEIICGMDFWKKFGISINTMDDINSVETDESNSVPLTTKQALMLRAIVDSFPNSERDGLGCTNLLEHNIDTGNATPIKQRYYPISPAREKILCAEIDRMLSLGVIEECPQSSWSSPGVLLVKPDKVRFCVDSRRLNAVTVKDSYPIPNIEGIISRLPAVNCISKVDLKDAFWQIRLAETAKPKTAFTVPNRPLYQFTRMPFGLCNAPQTMCRLMDLVIPYYMKSHVFVYLDDLLIVSENFEEHLKHLQEVAVQFRKAGLTINIKKSCFAIKQVKYLGYIVGEGCLRVDQDKVKAISEIPTPTSIRQLRQFLGMVGWYRRFIEDFSTLTFPLTELLSKKKSFKWNDEAQKSFELLKIKLCSAPVLVNPNFSKPFIVQCDASAVGVGAVLAQEDSEGIERPIAYMSQKLNKAQRNYTVTELECLAVVQAISKFRAYIEGQEFKVVTDHASLKWLMRQSDLSGRLARWALKLQGFEFTIEHRRGKENVVPDALSRVFEGNITEVEIEIMPSIDLNSDAFSGQEYLRWKDEITKLQYPDFKIVDNYIYKRISFSTGNNDEGNWKLLVPTELRNEVIYSAHNIPNASHGGIAKTIERIRRFFFWPRLVTDVKRYIGECNICKTTKLPTMSLKPPMGQMVETERPFQRLYLDLIGPFPRSRKGNIGILIVLDHFTKFTFLKPLRKFISNPIVTYLRDEVFNCYGVPEVIVTDNGTQFRSKEFELLLNNFGIKHQLTAVYSPQSNASERVNRSINAALRSYVRDDQKSWDVYLNSVNCALRNSVHQTTGESPYKLVFGQTMICHGKDYEIMRKLTYLKESDAELERMDKFAILRDSIQEKVRKAYEKNERTYNLRARNRNLEIGQTVVRRNFVQSSLPKNFCAKLAPVGVMAIVIGRKGNCYYELKDSATGKMGVYHLKDIWT